MKDKYGNELLTETASAFEQVGRMFNWVHMQRVETGEGYWIFQPIRDIPLSETDYIYREFDKSFRE